MIFPEPEGGWHKQSLALGIVIGIFSLLFVASLIPTSESSNNQQGLLTVNETCINVYGCRGGSKGDSIGNLKCKCNGTWRTFGYRDFVERVNEGEEYD